VLDQTALTFLYRIQGSPASPYSDRHSLSKLKSILLYDEATVELVVLPPFLFWYTPQVCYFQEVFF
jgi:hypothetical protein